jgi:predicted outer membrane repeat protein
MNNRQIISLTICFTLSAFGLTALLIFAAATRPVRAAHTLSLTVTSTDDSGPGSLRQAIADAGPGDSIDFALSYPATITLTSGELLITKPLTIAGPGPELLAVSGNHASRAFRVDDPAGAEQITVTLSNLTIADGQVTDFEHGGGLWNDENLTLTNINFSSNSSGWFGGGMYSEYSSPTLINVTFSGNSATSGGGIKNEYSSPTLIAVTFSGNLGGWNGGGMHNYESSPRLTDVTFSNNSAGSNGGGMYNDTHSSPALTDVTFSGNSAGSSGGRMGNLNPSGPTLSDVIFSDDLAGSSGGGMHNTRYSRPTLTNVTFRGNSAGQNGGGIYNEYSGPTLTGVTFSNNSGWNGGGMYDYECNPTLANVIFGGNSAHQDGGGIYNYYSIATLTNVTFNGNLANRDGGAIYNELGYLTIQNSILWGNRAASGEDQIHNDESTPAIAHSDLQGSGGSGPGWDPGLGNDLGGNLDVDPRFVNAVAPAAAPTHTGNLRLRWGSPAVDAGDDSLVPPGVTTDLDGASRFAYGTVDMGAYELQPGLYLYKDAGVAAAAPGQRFTYTLQAANAFTAAVMTGGLISDALPAGLVLAGPVRLDPPGAGLVGAVPPTLVSDLTISPAQIVTVTFPVTAEGNVALGTILTNGAALTSSQVLTPRLASHRLVVVGYLYLPLIFRGGGS